MIDYNLLLASPFKLLVIDYSRDGLDATRWTFGEITGLKQTGKLVLAYMSIGEAENVRDFYWEKAAFGNPAGPWIPGTYPATPGTPLWLDQPNPSFPDNYKVRYWEPTWRNIIFGSPSSYLDKIIDAGFDGVYLDIIDAYEYFDGLGRATAEAEMIQFVADIAHYARVTRNKPTFGIFPQNAEELLSNPAYLNTITGIAKEDLYYGDDIAIPAPTTATAEGFLDLAVAANKLVLTVDYAVTPAFITDAHAKASAKGYVEYVAATRDLDQLYTQP